MTTRVDVDREGAGARETPRAAAGMSFEDFVAESAPRLHRTAVLLCADHHLAEDLTQATYAKLFSRWAQVQRTSNPVAYARTTLLRTFLSQRRRRSSSEVPTDVVADRGATDPDTARRLDLLAALARLSPSDRTVLVLRYWEDLSVHEVSRLLDLKEATLRARTSRALGRLRTHLPDLEDPS